MVVVPLIFPLGKTAENGPQSSLVELSVAGLKSVVVFGNCHRVRQRDGKERDECEAESHGEGVWSLSDVQVIDRSREDVVSGEWCEMRRNMTPTPPRAL